MVQTSRVIDGLYAFRLVVHSYVSISDIPFTKVANRGNHNVYWEQLLCLRGALGRAASSA